MNSDVFAAILRRDLDRSFAATSSISLIDSHMRGCLYCMGSQLIALKDRLELFSSIQPTRICLSQGVYQKHEIIS